MPYVQDEQYVYWYDPNKREHRIVGVRLGDYVGYPASGPPRRERKHSEDPDEVLDPGPHGVRNTTVQGPPSPWVDPPRCRLTARKR